MECQKVVSHKSNGAPKTCGREGTTYVLKGGLASVLGILCDRHSSAFRREGYLLERPATDVVRVFTGDPITRMTQGDAAILSLTNGELVQALPIAAVDASDSQQPDDIESNCGVPADASGEAAPETQEPATDPVFCAQE